MRQQTYHAEGMDQLAAALGDIRAAAGTADPARTIAILATNLSRPEETADAARALGDALPGCPVVGITMLDAVGEGIKVPRGIDVTVLSLETSGVDVLRYDCSLMTAERAGECLSEDLRQIPDARCVVMLSAGVSPDQMLESISHDLDHIPIFGVPAGSHVKRQDAARVVVDGALRDRMVVCVVLSGPELFVRVGRSFGWRPFGKSLRVTDGDDQEAVSGIDGVTPSALYARYLHLDTERPDFVDMYAFPFVTGTGASMTANVPLSYDPDGTFHFSKRMPLGSTVSLGYARESDLLLDTLNLANDLAAFRPQALLVAYCQSRTIFLGNDLADREQGYLYQAFAQASICYGFGEVLRQDGRGGYRNNTITACALREGDPPTALAIPFIADDGIDAVTTANPRLLGRIVNFLEEATRDLRWAASFDEMTGLLRRSAMESWLAASRTEVQSQTPLTVVMLDVDSFKTVNDRYGHAVGDRVLVAVAGALRQAAGADAAVSRWGGDELLCASMADEDWALGVADGLRRSLADTDLSPVPRITVSVGIATMTTVEDDCEGLIHRADSALYRSKHVGGDQVTVWSPDLEDELETDATDPVLLVDARSAVERSSLPILVYRMRAGHYEAVVLSDGYCRMTGATRDQILGRPDSWDARNVHPHDVSLLEKVARSLVDNDTASFTYRLMVDGSYHQILGLAQRISRRNPSDLVAVVCHDLTTETPSGARSPLPTASLAQDDPVGPVYRALLEPMGIPLAVLQHEGDEYRFVLVSDGACKLYGEARPDLERYLTNRSFSKTHPDDAAMLLRTGARLQPNANIGVTFRLRVGGGSDYHRILIQSYPQAMPDGSHLRLIFYIDLDDAGVQNAEARKVFLTEEKDDLYHDRLTGLPNLGYYRTFARGKALELASVGERPAVVFLDVRGMRAYNDRYGYERGDDLLQAAAAEIAQAFPGALACRYTEDHFVVVGDLSYAENSARAARDALVRRAGDELVDLGAGIYALATPEEDMTSAVDRARMAADYAASQPGVRCRVFDQEVADHYARRDYVLGSWQRAIDQGWVKAFFQPVVDSFSGRITSYEVLARWQDPERGLLSPADFIPTLEESGLLYAIDMEVLRQTAAHQGERLRRGWEVVPISVNLSRHDLAVPGIHESINDTLARYGVPRGLIAFEITETALVDHGSLVREHIACFHEDGYLVYLDDFGSGYSSLNTLQDFDFDVLKIDMAFLRHANEKTPAILSDVVDMAKRLGMATLAEGVETEEEADFLHGIGCGMLQGFLYSRPLPIGEAHAVRVERGLEFETGDRRAFFQELSRVNVLDVGSPLAQVPPRPLAEQYPMLVVALMDGRLSVVYENERARESRVSLGLATLEGFEAFLNVLMGRGSVREALRLADEADGEAVQNYVGTRYRARVTYRLVAHRQGMRGYLVVAHDPLIEGDEDADPRALAYWRLAEGAD